MIESAIEFEDDIVVGSISEGSIFSDGLMKESGEEEEPPEARKREASSILSCNVARRFERVALSRAARRDGMSVEAVLDSKKETKEIAEVQEESSEEEEEGGGFRILKTVEIPSSTI